MGCGFNEAGANCPGKLRMAANHSFAYSSFNEAGANCPGKHRVCKFQFPRKMGFNEAGANCPGKQRNDFRSTIATSELQ